ncbi:hypothetical protein [Bradyrhizobium vignae]|uniref:Uncharacterized protein n=1 Tax=Bradyrhizobium vignae TaxID=1549949 RepID=A0ABS4A1Z4_9BRAD|nr:hypothetical protein [Bradyrhizobium vignae]MBP0114408.1 hypothetical protein [Bradyrhizobium vignae]
MDPVDLQTARTHFERYMEAARLPQTVTFLFDSEDAMWDSIPSLLRESSPILKGHFVKLEAGVRPGVRERFDRNKRLMARVAELAEKTGEDAVATILKRAGWRAERAPHSQIVLLCRDAEQLRCAAEEPLGKEVAYELAALEQGLISPLTVKDIVLRERLPTLQFTVKITVSKSTGKKTSY